MRWYRQPTTEQQITTNHSPVTILKSLLLPDNPRSTAIHQFSEFQTLYDKSSLSLPVETNEDTCMSLGSRHVTMIPSQLDTAPALRVKGHFIMLLSSSRRFETRATIMTPLTIGAGKPPAFYYVAWQLSFILSNRQPRIVPPLRYTRDLNFLSIISMVSFMLVKFIASHQDKSTSRSLRL
jgi:hypothetical protein